MSDRYMISKKSGNRYELQGVLGKGTTATVYCAKNMEDQALYAVKVSENQGLLQQESELLRELSLPGTEPNAGSNPFPQWKEYFQDDINRKVCLVMEYVSGPTLEQVIQQKGRMKPEEAAGIASGVLEALKHLHHHVPPLVYRDIKPENIILQEANAVQENLGMQAYQVRIIDLGGAASKGYRVGTYGYSAPEQFWQGTVPEPSWDIYGTGKLLAYMLTGKNPCQPPYDMLAYCSRDSHVPEEFLEVLRRSMAVESEARYQCAEELQKELREAMNRYQKRKKQVIRSVLRRIRRKKTEIVYEKCVWRSKYKRIF